ncbi:unnamed protein product [Leptidea sinapis]|uniref:Uncharacterized protein n=1 Tax=Leptidea sinapis TaxID=189913 RepID=A0A5E4Q5L8_9NEOP|nr:unnamed protein product [Leptidea sinapis]
MFTCSLESKIIDNKLLLCYIISGNKRVSVPGYAGGLSASLAGGAGGAAWERLGAELVLSGLVSATYFAAMERRWTGAAPALLGAAYCAASFSHWVCWVGGLGGGVASGLLHEWASRKPRGNSTRASSPRDLDDLDKPAFPSHHYRHASTYCSATAPRPGPETSEPLYSGSKSLYCRSPPPARHTLHRSDGTSCQINGCYSAAVQDRRESLYSSGTRRGPLSSEDSAYGSYAQTLAHTTHTAHAHGPHARAFRSPLHPPEHY